MEPTVDSTITDYFVKNYRSIIPLSSEVKDTICQNDMQYGKWLEELKYPPIYFKSTIKVNELYKNQLYSAEYEISWIIYDLPYPESKQCYGAKCHRDIPRSFKRWCVDCYGHFDNEKLSVMVKIMIKKKDTYDNLTVRELLPYIYDVKLVELKKD